MQSTQALPKSIHVIFNICETHEVLPSGRWLPRRKWASAQVGREICLWYWCHRWMWLHPQMKYNVYYHCWKFEIKSLNSFENMTRNMPIYAAKNLWYFLDSITFTSVRLTHTHKWAFHSLHYYNPLSISPLSQLVYVLNPNPSPNINPKPDPTPETSIFFCPT